MPVELRQMRAVDAIVQTVVSNHDDIAFISGSLVEGFGNHASDIDVFLVTAGEPEYRGPFGSVLGDFYLDLEVYRLDRMLQLSAGLDALDSSDFSRVWLTPLADLDLYYRTLIGRACHNPEAFAAMRAGFRHEVIRPLLATWCGLRHVAHLQYAREELDCGRGVAAALAAQSSAAAALDSYLAAQGEAFPSLKWRFEKLARLHGASSALYQRAWRLKATATGGVASYVAEVATFGAELGMQAYADWCLDDVPLQPIGDVRSHVVGGDALLVQNQRFVYAADDTGRELVDALRDGPATRRQLTGAGGTDAPRPEVGQRREAIAALQARALVCPY